MARRTGSYTGRAARSDANADDARTRGGARFVGAASRGYPAPSQRETGGAPVTSAAVTTDRRHSASNRRRRTRPLAVAALLLLAATALALAGAASASAAEPTQYTLIGRGWGHGVGMSQYGAYGYARHGWTYRQIISHYYTGITFGTVENKTIRVLLTDGQGSVRLSASQTVTAQAGSDSQALPASTQISVTVSGSGFLVKAGSVRHTFSGAVTFSTSGALLQLANANSNARANMHYRGALTVQRSSSSGLMVVDALPLEDYIRGVVPNEVSSTWPAEAVKAQAVAARSFGAQRIGSAGPFDIYCDGRSQCYNGADTEAPGSDAAVSGTLGVVPLYKGKPIIAAFFSSSGGYTENSENVWSGSAVPYLRGVPDPYDTYAPDHLWPDNPIRLSSAALTAKLGRYAPSGGLVTLYVTKRGASPRIVTAYAVGASGATAVSGSVLRVNLGLRSSWVDIRSMSIRQPASATAGGQLVLRGRTFPELPADAKVVLRVKVSGKISLVPVPATGLKAITLKVPGGQTARGTQYAVTIKPAGKATYSFAYGVNQSPTVGVKRGPGLDISVPQSIVVGQSVSVDGTATGLSLAGRKIKFQVAAGAAWVTVSSGTVGSGNKARLTWSPTAAGSVKVRLFVPAGSGRAAVSSTAVEVVVSAPSTSPSPSVSPSTSSSPSLQQLL